MNDGRVNKERFIKPNKNIKPTGSLSVCLCARGKIVRIRVAVIALTAFTGRKPYPKAECRHLDDNQNNNCITNLVWGSRKDNVKDAIRNKRYLLGNAHRRKLTDQQRIQIYKTAKTCGLSHKEQAKKYGVSPGLISEIANGRNRTKLLE